MIRVIAIVGPTAAGKTRLAVDVAHELGSQIVSVDSRQVYRGLDLGSGKDLDEYRRTTPAVPVHLVDVADPGDVYSVFHYQSDCYRLFAAAAERPPFREGTPLVMAGGTGLYLEAVLKGYRIPDVPEDAHLRGELMKLEREELVERLRRQDPSLASKTDQSNKKRVVRALEIAARARLAPIRYSDPPPLKMVASVFVVDVDRRELNRRIDERLDERLARGLVEEVRGLLDGGLPPARMMRLGLEYREVTAYLTGGKKYNRMTADLKQGIHLFAKRQQTWFRGLERRGIPVTRVTPGDKAAILAGLADEAPHLPGEGRTLTDDGPWKDTLLSESDSYGPNEKQD
jgi:tRNA dimethylallyltransferase